MENTFRITLMIVAVTALLATSGCSFFKSETEGSVKTEDVSASADRSGNEANEEGEMMMPGPILAKDLKKYQADLPLEDRKRLAAELTGIKAKDGMEPMKKMFPDFKQTKVVPDTDPFNMMQMGEEIWFYSEEGNMTVVFCKTVNTPIQIFEKKDPTIEEVKGAMKKMKEAKTEGIETNQGNEPTAKTGDTKAKLVRFNQDTYKSLLGKEGFALYFHADWCPICFALEKSIQKELPNLPEGVQILQVDYDNSADLQEKYGVARQSTIVYIDSAGVPITVDLNPNMKRFKSKLEEAVQ